MSVGTFTLDGLEIPGRAPMPRSEETPFVLCAFDSESNPVGGVVSDHSVAWAVGLGMLQPHEAADAVRMDLGHIVGYGYPSADYDQLRLMGDCALLGTVLRDRAVPAEELALLLAVLRAETTPPDDPRADAMAELRIRLLALGGPEWLDGFAEAVAGMFDGFSRETVANRAGRVPTPEAHAAVREHTVGLYPMFLFAGPVEGLVLPPAVRSHAAILELTATACRIVGYARDLFTHREEIARGCVHNLVLVTMREHAVLLDKAIDRAVSVHDDEVRHFVRTAAELPSFGSSDDAVVQEYVELLRRWVGGHRKWAEYTGRYRRPD
jgi:hypothetical protein